MCLPDSCFRRNDKKKTVANTRFGVSGYRPSHTKLQRVQVPGRARDSTGSKLKPSQSRGGGPPVPPSNPWAPMIDVVPWLALLFYNADSGPFYGKGCVPGGWKPVRDALCTAVRSSSRCKALKPICTKEESLSKSEQ